MDAQIGAANLGIRDVLSQIVPGDWLKGQLLVLDADKNDESLCTIDNAFINLHSTEQINKLTNSFIKPVPIYK